MLEFSTVTFTPTLSLKIGRLLSSTPTTLRIKLHPSSLPPVDDDQYYEDGEMNSWESGKPKIKFGQPEDDESDWGADEWEGEWGDVRVF